MADHAPTATFAVTHDEDLLLDEDAEWLAEQGVPVETGQLKAWEQVKDLDDCPPRERVRAAQKHRQQRLVDSERGTL